MEYNSDSHTSRKITGDWLNRSEDWFQMVKIKHSCQGCNFIPLYLSVYCVYILMNLIWVYILVNTTNLEYICTGLNENFGRGDSWYPPQSHSSGRNFFFLWGGQVHLFSYSRIESESTTTLVTKATNTRWKQQNFQPTEAKKSLNIFFITLGAFPSPSGQGVAWFKEEKNSSWKHIHQCHIALNTPCLPPKIYHDRCFQFHWGRGEGGWEELNKMVRCIWAMWEWWFKQKQSPNLHWAKESYSGALARAKRAHSGAPWVRKFGYDVAYARPPTRTNILCKPMSNVTIDLAQLD